MLERVGVVWAVSIPLLARVAHCDQVDTTTSTGFVYLIETFCF